MTPKEQEVLYQKVRKKFRIWTDVRCSGYVHGVVDETRREGPHPKYVKKFPDDYALGYIRGFADARGPDILVQPWVAQSFLLAEKINFEWWKKEGG